MSEPNPKDFVQNFIDERYAEIMDIIKKYPKQIPIPVVADLIGSGQASVRESVEGGALGIERGVRTTPQIRATVCLRLSL